jgi:hypothetical protein
MLLISPLISGVLSQRTSQMSGFRGLFVTFASTQFERSKGLRFLEHGAVVPQLRGTGASRTRFAQARLSYRRS